jgi:hypothetical protein
MIRIDGVHMSTDEYHKSSHEFWHRILVDSEAKQPMTTSGGGGKSMMDNVVNDDNDEDWDVPGYTYTTIEQTQAKRRKSNDEL